MDTGRLLLVAPGGRRTEGSRLGEAIAAMPQKKAVSAPNGSRPLLCEPRCFRDPEFVDGTPDQESVPASRSICHPLSTLLFNTSLIQCFLGCSPRNVHSDSDWARSESSK